MPESGGVSLPARGTVLGFDFGEKRTGVAVGELETGLAHPLETIHAEGRRGRLERIDVLVAEWRPVLLVVGLPTHGDGRAHEMAPAVQRFGRQLRERFGVPVHHVDEYLTSHEAGRRLAEAGVGGRRRAALLDEAAAAEILQSFLETRHAPA